MKHSLLSILLFLSVFATGQQLKNYRIDEQLTLPLPDNLVIKDTLSQTICSGETEHGYIVITHSANPEELKAGPVADFQALKLFYWNVIRGFVNGSNADESAIVSDNVVRHRQLYWGASKISLGFGTVTLHTRTLLLKNNIYMIVYRENGFEPELSEKEFRDLFAAIQTPGNRTITDQFSSGAPVLSEEIQAPDPFKLTQALMPLILIVVVIVVVVRYQKRKNTGDTLP